MPYGLSPSSKYLIEPAESVNRNWEWYTIRSSLDITPTGDRTDTSQLRFEAIIEMFETRAQPAVIGDVFTTTETDPPDLPALLGAGPSTVYNLRLGVEHKDAWDDLDDFLVELHGRYSFVYDVASPTSNNVSASKADKLS